MVRFGIVGAGKIANKFAREIQYADNATLVAVASRSLEKANTFAKTHEIEHAFGSYEALASSDLIDAVYIATPHSFHKEQSILFMNHKKHVLCEKPIAVSTSEFEEMVDSARENDVLLMEAMWTRFLPVTLKIREAALGGSLGKLKHAYLEFGADLMNVGGDFDRLLNPLLAGGSLLDVGIYPVAFTLNLINEPVVDIIANATFYKTGIDLEVDIEFTFEGGSTTTLLSSFKALRNMPGVMEFEHGTIIAENFWKSEKVTINGVVHELPYTGEGFPHQIISFVETIEKGQKENEIMTHEESRKCMKLLDRIREEIDLVYPFEK